MPDKPEDAPARPTIAALRRNMSSEVTRRWRNLDPANDGKTISPDESPKRNDK